VNPFVIIWILLLVGGFWLLVIRPRRRQAEKTASLRSDLSPGDGIVTIAGIYGVVDEVDGDDVWVEIADGVVIRMASRAIAGRVPPSEHDDGDAEDEHEDSEAADEDLVDETDEEPLEDVAGDQETSDEPAERPRAEG
jgi:preprotein translocase subunit YajC